MYGLYHKIVSYSYTGHIHYGLSCLLFHAVLSSFSKGCQMHFLVRKTGLVQRLVSKFLVFCLFYLYSLETASQGIEDTMIKTPVDEFTLPSSLTIFPPRELSPVIGGIQSGQLGHE